MLSKRSYPRTQNILLLAQFAGDTLFAFAGLALGAWVRFMTPFRSVGVEDSGVTLETYLPLLAIGTAFLVGTYAYLKVYDGRLLLRPWRTGVTIAKATVFWFAAFLGTTLALKFEPSVSRLFVAISCLTTLFTVTVWRSAFHLVVRHSRIRERLVQRVLIVGWSTDARQLVEAVTKDRHHPYEIVGWVATDETTDPSLIPGCPCVGTSKNMEDVVKRRNIDIAIVADLDIDTEELLRMTALCERLYVQFKVVPSFFRIFVTNLRLQTISGVPVLGIEELRIAGLFNAAVKRAVDIIGALVGLALSAPVIAALTLLIRRESPGPVIYRQVRTGRHGRPFTIYKLRSMRIDAEKAGAQWAVAADPRRLKIGAFMREWNLDELPQFWNVLTGDMSLVGPRPERPELIEKFEKTVPHYNPRHTVRPGLTGWAQVNGLRGNTSLVDRIKYDLYYIENWSLWFDLQIMLLTFFKNKNAY